MSNNDQYQSTHAYTLLLCAEGYNQWSELPYYQGLQTSHILMTTLHNHYKVVRDTDQAFEVFQCLLAGTIIEWEAEIHSNKARLCGFLIGVGLKS